jgi:WD40 repeat protein
MEPTAPRRNPYVGPRAFQTGEALYGRDRDTLNLYYLLLAERVVLLFSPSGAGKTSLIQAGLIPRLKEKFDFIPVIRVNQEPPETLVSIPGFNRYIYSALSSLEEIVKPEDRLPAAQLAGMGFSDYLSRLDQPSSTPDEPARHAYQALIFDQFEEILTTAPNDYAGKQVFFDQLGEALRDNRRWALFSARQDYAAAFEPYLRSIPTRFANRFRLDLLDAEMALQVIQNPARDAGVEFTDAAAQKLVDDLRRIQNQRPDGTSETELGRYVESVQLQVVCYRLWNNLAPGETSITEKQLASVGSVNVSLSNYYGEQVASASLQFNVPQRLIREWFNDQLITRQGIRSQVILEPGTSGGLDNRVIRFMESAHLVRAEKRAGSTWYELAHDRLIEPVRLDNEKWLSSNLSLLQQQAALWNQQDRPESLILSGNELVQARAWALEHAAELLPYEDDFLLACKAEEIRALRLKRRNQVISFLGVLAFILAIAAFLAYRQADFQRSQAQRQERVSRAGQLAAQSHNALDEFPQRSLLLALEALKVTQIFAEAPQAPAEESLRAALAFPHGQPLGRQEKPLTVIVFSRDWLAEGGEDGFIQLWDRRGGTLSSPILLKGSGGAVRLLAFSPDGKWLASGGDSPEAQLWDLTAPKLEPLLLAGHDSILKSLAFDPRSRWLATGSVDETIRLWDLHSQNPSRDSKILRGHTGDISALAFSPDGTLLASGSLDATVRLWDLVDPEVQYTVLPGHLRIVNTLAFSPDGRWLASGSFDHTVRLWDLKTREKLSSPLVFPGHEDEIYTLAFSPGGHWLATGSADHSIRLLDMASPDPLANPRVLRGHTDAVNSLVFSPGGEWLASGGADHTIRLWDMTAIDPAADPGVLRGHDDQVSSLSFSPDGLWLASASRDNSSRIWRMDLPSPAGNPNVLVGHTGAVSALSISADGHWLATGSVDHTTQLYDLHFGIPPQGYLTLRKQTGAITALAFSPNEKILATAGVDTNILLWDLTVPDASENPRVLAGHAQNLTSLAFSLDGRYLASGDVGGNVRLWDMSLGNSASTGQDLGVDPDHDVTALAFDPGGKWLAASSGFKIRLWNLQDFQAAPLNLERHEGRVTELAFSPDGHFLATGSLDGTVRIWDLHANEISTSSIELKKHSDWVTALAFSPAAAVHHWFASGSKDKTVLLWDLDDLNKDPIPLRGHDGGITSIVFSQDGHWLASAGKDRTIRIWDLGSANPDLNSIALSGHQDNITAIAFLPGDKWLASASEDHTTRLWPLQLEDLKAQACAQAGRNLSHAEWEQFFSTRQYETTCSQWPPVP